MKFAADEIMSLVFGSRATSTNLPAHIVRAVNETEKAIIRAIENGFTIGKKVRMYSDPEEGLVIGYNRNPIGAYHGARFPVIVHFNRGTFEYSMECLTLVGEK